MLSLFQYLMLLITKLFFMWSDTYLEYRKINSMSEETKQNLQNKSTWKRILYMLLFVFAYSAAEFVLTIVVLIQIGFKLVTGSLNTRLQTFGKQGAFYINDVLLFLTFNSEDMPFPFSEWPDHNRG